MKLITWNCARGFDKKKGPDLPNAIRTLLSFRSAQRNQPNRPRTTDTKLSGPTAIRNIGMGVFYRKNWTLRRLDGTPSGIEWVIPFAVTGPQNFTLIAVWACQIKGDKSASYVGQIDLALRKHRKWFENGPVVMMGDFNSSSNLYSDKERHGWNHSKMVNELRELGLVSVYHALANEDHGKEKAPTFHQSKDEAKPFHFDYIFAPQEWLARMNVTVGSYAEWRTHSDHCPVTAEIFG